MKILILGGYGNTGFLIARYLLSETEAKIIIAGRNPEKAKKASEKLNSEAQGERVSYTKVDATVKQNCIDEFRGCDLIVVASSTIDYAENVAAAALENNCNYIDTQLSSSHKLEVLYSMADKVVKKEKIFVTDGGYHPGLPAVLVRYAATKFYKLVKGNVYAYMQIDWKSLEFSDNTEKEFIIELSDFNPSIYKNKNWQKLKYSKAPKIDFNSEFGEQLCVPMFMEELKELPNKIESLEETGFYISGFDWFTNMITMPVGLALLKLAPNYAKGVVTRLFKFGTNHFIKPPYGVQIILDAQGIINGNKKSFKINIKHEDGYYLTAIPTVICIKQILNGTITKRGVITQGNAVEPNSFMEDFRRFVKLEESEVLGKV